MDVLARLEAPPVSPPWGWGATKGFFTSWGIIKLKFFIPLARISGILVERQERRKIVPAPVGFFHLLA
jgi:hypothetical protein